MNTDTEKSKDWVRNVLAEDWREKHYITWWARQRAKLCHVLHYSGWVGEDGWVEALKKVLKVEDFISLLHIGLDVPYSSEDVLYENRISFYLTLADRWKDEEVFAPSVSDESYKGDCSLSTCLSEKPLRFKRVLQKISKKAFEVVSVKFFGDKNNSSDCQTPEWFELVALSPSLLAKIAWFFRLSEVYEWRRGREFVNLSPYEKSELEENIESFLLRLCRFILGFERSGNWGVEENQKVRDLFDSYKSFALESLLGLKKLDIIIDGGYKLDESLMEHLKKLALSENYNLPDSQTGEEGSCVKTRKAATIKEAILGGSQAAMVYTALRIKQEQIARFKEIRIVHQDLLAAQEAAKKVVSAPPEEIPDPDAPIETVGKED